jgi:hypothetical protein
VGEKLALISMKAMIDNGCRQYKKRMSTIWLAATGRQVQILIFGHGVPTLSKILVSRKYVAWENENFWSISAFADKPKY